MEVVLLRAPWSRRSQSTTRISMSLFWLVQLACVIDISWMILDRKSNLFMSWHLVTILCQVVVRWIWRRRPRSQADSLLRHCVCLLSSGRTSRISLLIISTVFSSEDRSYGRSTARVQAIPISFPLPSNYFCLQMPDMSRTDQNPTWWSHGFPAFIYCEPADRLDGSADQRGCSQLLPAWEPGPDTP